MGTAHIPEPPVARPPAAQAAPAGGSSAGGGTPQEPPDEFIDPISAELMLDPVLLLDSGQSYSRSTIEAWFARCKDAGLPCTDPLSGKVLSNTTTVCNFALKSMVTTWADRHKIADLPSFSKRLARIRSQGGASSSASAAAAAAAAELGLLRFDDAHPSASHTARSAEAGSSSGGIGNRGGGMLYPDVGQWQAGQPSAASGNPAAAPHPPQAAPPPPAVAATGDAAKGAGPALAAHTAGGGAAHSDPLPSTWRPGIYPSSLQPAPPVSKEQAADTALTALRTAASQRGGGSEGGAAYHAWTLLELAAAADGRDYLWEANAVPLAIFVLGQPPSEQQQGREEAGGLEAAKPALCGMLHRMGARDADVAASIAQCGGVQVLVSQLTAERRELRIAACRALYFLGWQGREIRASVLEALSAHAAACRLPPRPLLAFWRFWEQRQPAAGAVTGTSLAGGRESEWEPLSLLLHMLAEGCSGAAASSLSLLDASASAVPDVLAVCAAASDAPAVRFAALSAAKTLAVLPANLPLLLEAALGEGARCRASLAADDGDEDGGDGGPSDCGESSTVAGRVCELLWGVCYSPSRGGSLPAVVAALHRHADKVLDTLEAALAPGQKPAAECKWLAAGLLACLMHEPPHSDPAAAAAADGMRALLAQQAAAPVLVSLLELLCADSAKASPQTAAVAALAVGNMAAYRGAAQAPALSPRVSVSAALQRTRSGAGGSGAFGSALAGSGGSGDVGGMAKLAARLSMLARPGHHPGQSSGNHAETASPPTTPPHFRAQPTEPRSALLHHGAVQRLLRLLIDSSAGARAAASAAVPAALTPQAQNSAAAAHSAAAEAAALQRGMLAAALQALNNLCADRAAANQLRAVTRAQVEVQLDLREALNAAMVDHQLQPATRELARRMLHTESGAPGQPPALACSCTAPPARPAAYPNP